MKKCFIFLIFFSLCTQLFAQQYYYKVIGVYDNNLNPLSKNHTLYISHMHRYVIYSYIGNGISLKFHNGSAMYMPYAYRDQATGNHFYAPQFMGQPMLTDMFGNYNFIQFENGTNKMLIAMGGLIDECKPVSEEEYFSHVRAEAMINPYNNNSSSNSFQSKESDNSTGSWNNKQCTACNGTGKSIAKTNAPYYGGTRTKSYCEICKSYEYPHSHKTCGVCKGKGYVKEYKY